jgi:phosphate transport system substrate-binding protein
MKVFPVRLFGVMLILLLTLPYCNSGKNADPVPDTPAAGTLYISCDESFKPVFDQHAAVYQSKYTGTRIIIRYKPEADCLRDILVDSIQMVIATRAQTPGEAAKVSDSLHKALNNFTIAHDLVAVVVHPSARDSFFTMEEIRQLLAGKHKEDLIPVLDGTSATSTVRFMLDSVLRGGSFGKNVVAAQSSTGVLDYVSRTPNAVGFVGYSWIGNMDDTAQAAWRRKIRLASVESTDSAGYYVSPSQLFIYTKSYPMVRDLVYIMKERHFGIAHGFARFLETMPGQLIFRRSYIMPVILPNYVREAQLKDTINKY